MKYLNRVIFAMINGLLAVSLFSHPAQGAGAIDYQACLNGYGYTPTAVGLCSADRPSTKQAKPIEYRHCFKMYSGTSTATLMCSQYRPENRIAKPIEYAHCLKWMGRSNPGCLKYKP